MKKPENKGETPDMPQNGAGELGVIVTSGSPVIVVGGARGAGGQEVLDQVLALRGDQDWPIVAADSGGDLALSAKVLPDAVIGDLDSLSDEAAARIGADRLHRITEQDSTDFDKVLRHVSAPMILGVGFQGARLDHELAALSSLARFAHQPCILIGARDVTCLCPPRLALGLDPNGLSGGDRLSLFPLGPVSGRSQGLEWPIDGIALSPMGRIGTSNRIAKGAAEVQIEMEGPGALLILPRRGLTALMEGLTQATRWP